MMGERPNPKDSIDYTVPVINSGEFGFDIGSLADYFGIPTGVANLDVNVLPFRAYAKIWDDWYRDTNLQDSIINVEQDLGDSNLTPLIGINCSLVGKKKDYFTSAYLLLNGEMPSLCRSVLPLLFTALMVFRCSWTVNPDSRLQRSEYLGGESKIIGMVGS
ncbi:unnamed protein product [Cylicocyclus nassatus]|uniref:Uncharacterized protein n=1 Tax=Cylicocyclus nassatus TaxID=53992 RepID=A0AA36M475_CYLNA|nr:unnamed protein product [Cylicocyclus nassatus]